MRPFTSITDRVAGSISFRQVSKTFEDGTRALAGVDLRVEPGEFVSIVGPSGCGKSTMLRMASRLAEPTSGAVDIGPGAIGFVFQDSTLLHWRTVAKNVELLMELRGVPQRERAERRARALRTVGLSDFATHYPRQLSGGMRMRVSIARALTLDPDIFLFDEPFGALDELTREHLNDELTALVAARRFTALFVTHNVFEAVFVSTRVVVMSDRPGRVVGAVDVPFGYPRTARLRFDTQFTRIAERVSALLRSGAA